MSLDGKSLLAEHLGMGTAATLGFVRVPRPPNTRRAQATCPALLWLCAFALGLAGCGGPSYARVYAGPERAPEEIAVIARKRARLGQGVFSFARARHSTQVEWTNVRNRFESLPGTVELVVILEWASGGMRALRGLPLSIPVLPGRSYEVRASSNGSPISAWAIDTTTNQIVASAER